MKQKRMSDQKLSEIIRRVMYAPPMAPTLYGVFYGRVSTKGQLDGSSMDGQRDDSQDWAVDSRIEIVKHYEEPGESAWQGERPVLKRLLADLPQLIAAGVSVLVVWSLDRFARNVQYGLSVIEQLRAVGIALVSVADMLDYSTPDGWKTLIDRLAAHEHYSHKLSFTMKTTTRRRVVRERKHVGPVPTGYDRVDGMLKPNADADAIRMLFDLYATELYSLTTLAEAMNEHGYRLWSPRAKERVLYSKYTIVEMLRNSTYIGRLRLHGIEYESDHEPLISKEVWDEVQKLLLTRGSNRGWVPVNRQNPGLLNGILHCGICNARLWQHYKKRSYIYYECSNRQRHNCAMTTTRNDTLEPQALALIGQLRLPDNVIERVIARCQELQSFQQQAQPAPTPERSKKSQIAALKKAFLNDEISAADYAAMREALEEAPIVEEVRTIPPPVVDIEQAWRWLQNLPDLIQAAPQFQQARLIRSLFARFWATKKGIVACQPREPYLALLAYMQQSRVVSRVGSRPAFWDIPLWIDLDTLAIPPGTMPHFVAV